MSAIGVRWHFAEGEFEIATADLRIYEVGADDAKYPEGLRDFVSPPRLFVRGTVPTGPLVAIVGTRRPSSFGRRVAEQAALAAVASGLGVVSGLATGIDSIAHKVAVSGGGRTWAVIGSGVDVPTPFVNRGLAEEIVANGGGLLAEVPPGTPRTARSLVARDRIQSGLCLAVVICQCEVSSGAMHTARFAIAQRRLLVVALPKGRDAEHLSSSGNLALTDPGGIDPSVISATGKVASAIGERRPACDVIVRTPGELAGIFARLVPGRV